MMAKKAMMDGSLKPFTGPIRNQAGEEMVAAGATLSDGDLLGLKWFVEGVEGDLPK